MDISLLRSVRHEFKTLEKWQQNPTPNDILAIAGALRHLHIDEGGLFRRGWNELRKEVPTMPKGPVLNYIDLGGILDLKLPHLTSGKAVALATDVTGANGARIMGQVHFQGFVSNEDLRKQAERMERGWGHLSWYNESVCMLLGPWQISRGTVIRYVANKLGARHYDAFRKPEDDEIRERIYVVLDRAFDFWGDNPQPHNLQIYFGETGNALHATILTMCQDFEESPHVQEFIASLDRILKPPPNLGFK